MLNRPQLILSDAADEQFDASGRAFLDPLSKFDIVAAVRRQIWVVIFAVVVGAILGVLYLVQAVPSYTSSVSILIDAKKVGMTAASPLEGSLTFESGAIDSQIQILTSDRLATAVASRLGLQSNFAFLDPQGSFVEERLKDARESVSTVLNMLRQRPPAPDVRDLPEKYRLLIASAILRNHLDVSRIGRTYVFAVSYTDHDPALAQAIAGQYANAYLEDQLDSKFDSTRRATNWMEERIRDLRAQSLAADEAVQKYRADNNLIEASGRLLNDQALTDATTQLTMARSALDTASARYQTLKDIIDTQDVNASLTASLDNPNVAQLRSRYLAASKLENEISSRYGATHQAAEKARRDMAEYKRLIFAELTNLLPGYKSDVTIAQAQVDSIQNTIDQLRQTSASNDSAMVKLRSLEQEAETLKTLYSTFLQKSQELQQQQSFPVTDARVISDASTPVRPSAPKKVLVLALSLMLGAMSGAAWGAFREWRDRGFRTGAQVRDELGLEFITNVPSLSLNRKHKHVDVEGSIPNQRGDGTVRTTLAKDALLRKVVDEPFSQFAESIRALRFKMSVEFPKRNGIVLGMVSMFPDEGKSTIAKNLASSLALQGTTTLLIDGDLRNPSLTNDLLSGPKTGLVDVIAGRVAIGDAVAREQESGLAFLPAGSRTRSAIDIFGSGPAQDLFEQLRRQFDVVIIDFPPVGSLTDALAANAALDGYFLVVQWGSTPRGVVREFTVNHPTIADKIIGVVLNKVDLGKLGQYGAYLSDGPYKKYAEKYFRGV